MDNDPHQFRAVVTFEDQGGKTLLTMSAVFATAELRDEVVRESGAIEGGNQHLECLDQYLTSEGAALPAGRRVEITRVFDAPRDLVWEAWTRPERFVQWWGPRDFTTPMCEIDLRPGGRLRFLMRPKEGPDIWCGGVFQQVEAPSKLVFTDYFTEESGEVAFPTECGLSEEWPVQALVTVILEDLGGKTRLTLRHDASGGLPEEFEGAEQGWGESFDRLGELLAS
ncbi:MAG TPA: SRPBCC domain-containing protein [Dehalococcoidia bacterium]|nr:SRPBCC domain-containing protein [Dehalococcoidia bacterium]